MLTVRRKRGMPQIYFDVIRPFQKLYWYIFRPYRPGVKTFVFYKDKLLLVRLGYAHKSWVLPGGGIDKGETPNEAAVREVKEESGIIITQPEYVGEQSNTRQYKMVEVFYFTATVVSEDITIDGQEIVDAGWFLLTALPSPVSPRVFEEIELYNNWKYGKN